jgi:plasmid stabilization system protein ParE
MENKEYELEVREEAREDMRQAYEWYVTRSENTGERFLQETKTTISWIGQHPETYAIREHGYRSAKVKSFPYMVLYAIIDPVVQVLRVFHTSRDPDSID